MRKITLFVSICQVLFSSFVFGITSSSQIDLESEKSVTICTQQKKSLTCSSPGSSIAITEAFWGRKSRDICPSDDGDVVVDCEGAKETPGIVRGMCEGKAACQLEAKHRVLQNPDTRHCQGVNKYLIVSYTCVPDAKEVTICDGEKTSLKCPASFKTFVNSVFWGRQSASVCPSETNGAMCTGAPESLKILKGKCDGVDKCDVTAAYNQVENGVENCPGIQKYLIINYSCKPEGAKGDEESDEESPGEETAAITPAINGEKVELDNKESSRLGMGGLKALDKVNTLIKQSDDGQLTDDQEKAIERMIIGGLEDEKKQTPSSVDVQGSTRNDIPNTGHHTSSAKNGEMNKQIVELAKLVDEATSRINYKKAGVARPRAMTNQGTALFGKTSLRKSVKRINVPHPVQIHKVKISTNPAGPIRRTTIPKKPTTLRSHIIGKIMATGKKP